MNIYYTTNLYNKYNRVYTFMLLKSIKKVKGTLTTDNCVIVLFILKL